MLCLDTRWLRTKRVSSGDAHFIEFVNLLTTLPYKTYESPFIQYLLEQQWPAIKNYVKKIQFSEYLWYTGTQIIYFKFALKSRDPDEPVPVWKIIGMTVLCLFTLFFWVGQVAVEYTNAGKYGRKAYWCNFGNLMDVTGFLLVLFLLVVTGC